MIGKAIAHYQIETLLGAGGMGEVYQARDTRLGRNVAMKMLPEVFASDPDRVARFEREAKLLASLNHANIAALYGMEQSDGKHFLVMELVEGETLAERIARGPVPVEEALKIAHQVADALEAAHEKGVIHRDLKPANVKITPEAKVKVLDFGLAKALANAPVQITSNSPTLLSAAATNAGIVLGTAGYMSPEQARGHDADQRSDIFSFGCVLFEMLAGRQTFSGETVTDIIASVVARDPDFAALPANAHPKLPVIIRRCLAKNRKERWHAIADVRVELEAIMADPHGATLQAVTEAAKQPLWRRVIPFAITAIVVALIAVAATVFVLNKRPGPAAIVARFAFALPEGQRLTNDRGGIITISHDGSNIVYAANNQLYVRTMGEMEARPLQGTTAQRPSMPFFSPDGQWVGYLAQSDRHVKKIAITGGAAVNICEMPGTFGGDMVWNPDEYIYFGQPQKIVRVSANGGQLETVVTLKKGEFAYGPQLLPGGDALLFTLNTRSETVGFESDNASIAVQSLKTTGPPSILIQGGSDGRYVPTGHIVYSLGTTLFAVPFNLKTLQKSGGPVPIEEGVRRPRSGAQVTQYAFSNTGSMAYIPGGEEVVRNLGLAIVDRTGSRKLLNVPAGRYFSLRIAPNGKQVAVDFDDGKGRNVWIHDLNDAAPIRKFTFGGDDMDPLWTRDGQRIVFGSERRDRTTLLWQRVDGGSAEPFGKIDQGFLRPQAEAWTPDGALIVTLRTLRNEGISALSAGPAQKPKLIINPPAGNASLSPDGRWLAYQSDESGDRTEIYVQPFPPTGEKHQITTDGGDRPLWSPDGKQLFFLKRQQIMSVDIQTQHGFVSGKITPLPIQDIVNQGPRPYDITPDGKQFIVITRRAEAEPQKAPPEQINIILNWFEVLKQRAPVK